MKTREVLRRYAAGERDFRRTNLRGQSFEGYDLSGADFSEADIQGANFKHASLKGTNFTKVKAGVQKRWLLVQQLIAFVASGLSGSLSTYAGLFLTVYVDFGNLESTQQAGRIAGMLLVVLMLLAAVIAIVQHGLTGRALTIISIAFTATFTVTFAVAFAFANAGAGAFAGAGVLIVAGASAFAVAIATGGALAGSDAFTVALVLVLAFGNAIFAEFTDEFAGEFAFSFSIAVAFASLCLGIYCSWRAFKGDEKFALARIIGIAFGSTGGTTFCGANLTHANFKSAVLKGTNFNHTKHRKTILEWVYWQDAKKLDYARVGDSILANLAVRELLVTRNGYKKSYIDVNLRATNLDGVNLEQTDLTWADLTCATLHYANLKNANLTESLVLDTDFTGATLTGACLEAWNSDYNTKLNDVDCQYVYLLRNQQERRPSSGDFAPGEFTKLFQEVLSTVDLIFRNGVDWKAFVTSFQKVQVENEDTFLEIQSIENKGDGVVVVRVSVPPGTNKEKIHSEFSQQYEFALKALEARYQAELQAKEGEILRYREDSANMWEVIKLQAKKNIYVQAIAEAKAMNDSIDQSQNFNVGGDFNINATNAVVNLRDISGTVTNAINQLPETSDPAQPSLKQLLMQLKQVIESEEELSVEDKADLLEQVKALAEAKQATESEKREGVVRKARKIFDATIKSLPDTAKVVEACSRLLPLILKALGFPM